MSDVYIYSLSEPRGEVRYIGQTIDPHGRFTSHWRSRNANQYKHYPVYRWLRKMEKSGNTPEMRIVDIVSSDEADIAEIFYIRHMKSLGVVILNLTDGGKGGTTPKKWSGFVTPRGETIPPFTNLSKFCRDNGLDSPAMQRMSRGVSTYISHKGFSHINCAERQVPKYTDTWNGFINPIGQNIGTVYNLREFCKINNLNYNVMCKLPKGIKKSYRGWTYASVDPRRRYCKTYEGFINPSGQRVNSITNLNEFCRENNLSSSHMNSLISGRRKSHKGWTYDCSLGDGG